MKVMLKDNIEKERIAESVARSKKPYANIKSGCTVLASTEYLHRSLGSMP